MSGMIRPNFSPKSKPPACAGEFVVLFIDDDVDFRALLREAVEDACDEAGLARPRVVEADNGATGLRLLRELAFEPGIRRSARLLVCIDGDMPGLDGLGVLERLRKDHLPERICVLMVSGSADPCLPEAARRLGATAFFTKPQTGADLIALARSEFVTRIRPGASEAA